MEALLLGKPPKPPDLRHQRIRLSQKDHKLCRELRDADKRIKLRQSEKEEKLPVAFLKRLVDHDAKVNLVSVSLSQLQPADFRSMITEAREKTRKLCEDLPSERALIRSHKVSSADYQLVRRKSDLLHAARTERRYNPYRPAVASKVVVPKIWSTEAENAYRLQKAGYKNEVHFRMVNGMQKKIPMWPKTNLIKRLPTAKAEVVKFAESRECPENQLSKLALLDYDLKWVKQDSWRISLFQTRSGAVQKEAKKIAEQHRIKLLHKLHAKEAEEEAARRAAEAKANELAANAADNKPAEKKTRRRPATPAKSKT